jgi:DNA polymerase-3 subunit gamma/tau
LRQQPKKKKKPIDSSAVKPITVAEKVPQPVLNPSLAVSSATAPQEKEEQPQQVASRSFTSGKGWGAIKTSAAVPNLNTVFDEKTEDEQEENELVVGSEFREVGFDEFLAKWTTFADRMKSESKITIYTLMTVSTPRLLGNKIEIDVENMVQLEQIRDHKIDILNYLRVELRNFSLDLQAIQLEASRILKPYTSQEKYQAMVAKNPALETLRKTFNLGLS